MIFNFSAMFNSRCCCILFYLILIIFSLCLSLHYSDCISFIFEAGNISDSTSSTNVRAHFSLILLVLHTSIRALINVLHRFLSFIADHLYVCLVNDSFEKFICFLFFYHTSLSCSILCSVELLLLLLYFFTFDDH